VSRFAILFIGLVSVLQLLACNVYDSDLVTSSPLQKDHGNTDETPPDLDSGSYADQDSNDLPTLPINDARAHDDAKDANSNDASDAGDESDASDAGDENDASDAGDESDASDESDAAAVDSGAEDGGVDAGADTQVPTDNCPEDPDKTEPGVCGCGIPDTDTGGIASCTGLISAIVHRYRFDGTGTTIVDSAGSADGTTNAALAGDGKLTLAGGGSSDYATLPSGILSALSATTVEFWLTWQGSSQLQRTISFGTAVPATVSGNYCSSTSAEYHNGSWYQFCIANMGPWPTVRSSCEGAGGHLAAIESAEEEQYIENHSSFVKSVWIGANDVTTEGEWYFATADGLQAGTHFWSGGKNGSAVGGAYENWGSNEPANSDSAADCAFLYHAQPPTWRSLACSGYQGNFLCEWRGHQGR
jgi:hypothetical protein